MNNGQVQLVFVFDVSTSSQCPEYSQEFLSNCIHGLRKWTNVVVCTNKSAIRIQVALITFDHSTVEVVLPMRSLGIYTIHSCLNRISPTDHLDSFSNEIDTISLSLESSLELLSNGNEWTEKKVFLMSHSLKLSEKSQDALSLAFAHNISVHMIQPRGSECVTESGIQDIVEKYANCSLSGVFNRKFLYLVYCVSLTTVDPRSVEYALYLSLNQIVRFQPFPLNCLTISFDMLKIDCCLSADIVEGIKIAVGMVCQCHNAPLQNANRNTGICRETQKRLDINDIVEVLQIGEEALPLDPSNYQCETASIVELVAKIKIDLTDFSHSLLYGPSIILSSPDENWTSLTSSQNFHSLSASLCEKNQGLLVTSNTDLEKGLTVEGILFHYLILGESKGRSMLLRKIVTADEYIPLNNYSMDSLRARRSEKVEQALETLPAVTYSPLHYSTMYHDNIETLTTTSDPISRKRRYREDAIVIDDLDEKERPSKRSKKKPTPSSLKIKSRSTPFSSVMAHISDQSSTKRRRDPR